MSINVIKGPAAFAYQGRNGHTYWFGVASHSHICHKLRRTSDRALEDARKLEKAQKDLEKPPTHKWEHGDIFKTPQNNIMIYLKFLFRHPRTVCVVGACGGLVEQKNFKDVLQDARFLFNIKEKL